VLTVLHDVNHALHADDIVVIDGGRVAASGPAGTVLCSDLLATVWGSCVQLERTEAGALVVVPQRPGSSAAVSGGPSS
jgi:iron complex transport system ATP-binding protein